MTWEEALAGHQVYEASFDPAFWRKYLSERPEVLQHILADLYQYAGDKSRPASVDGLWDLVAPKYSEKPFTEAFYDVLGARSIRQIAAAARMHHRSLSRYLHGEKPVVRFSDPQGSMDLLETFARALGVQPAYFLEWRRLWVMRVIDVALDDHPNVSTAIYRKFSGQPARSHTHQEGEAHGAAR